MARFKSVMVLTLAVGAELFAAQGGSLLKFNEKSFELKNAYAFMMKIPDFDAMKPEDMQGGPEKMKWKKSTTIALSDHPFDAQALAKQDQPFDALEKMVKSGAVLVTATVGKDGKVDSLRVVLPNSDTALDMDTSVGTLTLSPPRDGKLSGRLIIRGDKKMHDFDPEHIPLIEADVSFVTTAPAP